MDAAATLTNVIAQVNAFMASAREQAKDGLTWTEFGRLFVQLIHTAVVSLDAVASLSGAEKKEISLTAVASLFDSFADRCVPLTMTPVWLVIRPGTRVLLLSIASGAVEAMLKITRSS